MPGAFWCIVEDDRQGNPKKVMAEVVGEASRLAGQMGAQAEAVWLTDKAAPEGVTLLGELGAKRIWLLENAAFGAYRGEVWTPVVAVPNATPAALPSRRVTPSADATPMVTRNSWCTAENARR